MRRPLSVIRDSPWMVSASSGRATRVTWARVEGRICPRTASTRLVSRTASSKLPVTSDMAAMKRLPKLWPSRPEPSLKRYWKRRVISGSASARAAMQLRRAPGGRAPSSRRRGAGGAVAARRPDEGGEEGGVQPPDAEDDCARGDEHEHGGADEPGEELQRDVVDLAWEGDAVVDLAQDVGEAEGHDRHADEHQRQPALDVHAEVEPLEEAAVEEVAVSKRLHRLANYKASFPTAKPH